MTWICVLNSLEQEKLIRFLLFHDQILTGNDSKHLLIARHLHTDNLIWLSLIIPFLQQRNLELTTLNLFKCINIVEANLIHLTYQKCIHALYWQSPAAIQVELNHIYPEVMFEFSPVYIETFLVRFEGYAVFYSAAKHHLGAVHEVEHGVFQSGFQSGLVNFIKEDFGVSGDLNTSVTFDVVDETSLVNGVVTHPITITRKLVKYELEKQDLRAASYHECIFVNQEHRTKVLVVDLLLIVLLFLTILIMGFIKDWNSETLTLPVECVNFIVVFIEKAFLREILFVTLHQHSFMAGN